MRSYVTSYLMITLSHTIGNLANYKQKMKQGHYPKRIFVNYVIWNVTLQLQYISFFLLSFFPPISTAATEALPSELPFNWVNPNSVIWNISGQFGSTFMFLQLTDVLVECSPGKLRAAGSSGDKVI